MVLIRFRPILDPIIFTPKTKIRYPILALPPHLARGEVNTFFLKRSLSKGAPPTAPSEGSLAWFCERRGWVPHAGEQDDGSYRRAPSGG